MNTRTILVFFIVVRFDNLKIGKQKIDLINNYESAIFMYENKKL